MPRCLSRLNHDRHKISFVTLLACLLVMAIALPVSDARAQNHIDIIKPRTTPPENLSSHKSEKSAEQNSTRTAADSAETTADPAPIKRQMYFLSDSGLIIGGDLLKREKYTAALRVFEDILSRNPRNVDAVAGLGAAYLGMDQTKAAGDQIRKALSRDNKHIGANYLLGRYYLAIDRPAQATEQLNVLYLLCGRKSCPEEASLEAEIDETRQKKARQSD